MTVTEDLKKMQLKETSQITAFQNASEKFNLLIEKGLVSKRAPIEIGRSDSVCKVYTYSSPKETKQRS